MKRKKNKNENLEKGDKLERIVGVIESLILRTNPNLNNNPYIITNKKTLIINGVRHEIDWYVEIDLGNGYKSVFIFECKNWEKTMDKNEIIVFSEKIKATNASKGYFITKKFGRYAVAQAKQDPRIELIKATDLLLDLKDSMSVFYSKVIPQKAIFSFDFGNKNNLQKPNINSIKVELKGEKIDWNSFSNPWALQLQQKKYDQIDTSTLPDGEHEFETEEERTFKPGSLKVDGKFVNRIKLKIKFLIKIFHPRIISEFDIEKKGRITEFEGIDLATGQQSGSRFILLNDGILTLVL